MKNRKILSGVILSLFILSLPVYAKSTNFQDIQGSTNDPVKMTKDEKLITPNNWVYKSLQNIARKYE